VVERVAQKMHVAALVGRLRQNFPQRCPQAGMIVGDDKLDAVQTARLEPQQEIPPARSALAVGALDRQHPRLREGRLWRRPSQSMPIAISTAWLVITPASRTRW
jgi:hypothetical protein